MNVFITGVSSGLGKELSLAFIERGDLVWGISRRDISDMPDELRLDEFRLKEKFIYTKCDIAKEDNILSLIDAMNNRGFKTDIAILNAALMENDIINNRFDFKKFDEVFNVNLLGNIRVMSEILPEMQTGGKKIVIGISSLSAYRATVINKIAYPATKAALNMIFESLRIQLYKKRLRFITVNLGPLSEKDGILSISYKKAAKMILSSVKKNNNVIDYPFIASFATKILRFFPDSFLAKYLPRVKLI